MNETREVYVERYYPDVVAPAQEFKAIAATENPEMNLLWQRMRRLFLNTFVYDIDEAGAVRWEGMLKLRPKVSDDLAARRRRILAKINAQIPYTHRQLQYMLDATYGAGKTKVFIDYGAYALWVDVLASVLNRTGDMRTFCRAIVPANMTIGVSSTQTLSQKLFAGGCIRVNKRVVIHPIVTFGAVEFNNTLWATGCIRKVTHTVIRS
ncbi:putative phage tail protein [Sporomusa paucivorans]|uniref:putative phage tail protein n=1 Tax=Sporomusa paucivorans TaxID=2376 RepID=UPI003570D032